ncbi:MAG: hypothetical protein V3U45_08310 [bacterium]
MREGAIVLSDQAFGAYRRGPNAKTWENPTPPVQGGSPGNPTPPSQKGRIPDPGYRILEGASFRYRVADWNSTHLPFYKLHNGARCYTEKGIRLEATRATVQIYSNGTVMVHCAPFRLAVDAIPEANDILDRVAWDAWARVARKYNIRLEYVYRSTPNGKAKGAAVPLMTGELVKPLPGYENVPGRLVVNAATELNASPPGLSEETADLLYAQADAQLPDRLLALERAQGEISGVHDALTRLIQANTANLERLTASLDRLNEVLGGIEDNKQPAGPGPEVR